MTQLYCFKNRVHCFCRLFIGRFMLQTYNASGRLCENNFTVSFSLSFSSSSIKTGERRIIPLGRTKLFSASLNTH